MGYPYIPFVVRKKLEITLEITTYHLIVLSKIFKGCDDISKLSVYSPKLAKRIQENIPLATELNEEIIESSSLSCLKKTAGCFSIL